MRDVTRERWRVGRSLGRTLYRQVGDEASKADEFIGFMETRELANQVVEAVNGIRADSRELKEGEPDA